MRRTLITLLLALTWVTGAQAQSDTGPLHKETSYVLRTHLSVPVDDLDECASARGFLGEGLVVSAETSSLYAISVNESTAKVEDDQVLKVGELLACWGPARPAVEGPAYPTEDSEVVYRFNIGEREFFALGTSRLRTPGNFLKNGLHLTGVDATVFGVEEGAVAQMLGAMSVNRLVNPNREGGYREGDMVTLRIFAAYNQQEYNALIDALRRAGLID